MKIVNQSVLQPEKCISELPKCTQLNFAVLFLQTISKSKIILENILAAPEEHLISASSVAEALQQRLDLYKQQQQAAQDQGNSGKARRMGRIVKQFEDAIKLNNAGKPIPIDDLPTPPGFAPIPVERATPVPAVPKREAPKPPVQQDEPTSPSTGSSKSPPTRSASRSGNSNTSCRFLYLTAFFLGSDSGKITTHAGRQLALLLARQKEFKLAALHAKQKGELAEAKEFLKTAKGFEPLINASQGGLPVDISSLPIPPSAKSQLDEE